MKVRGKTKEQLFKELKTLQGRLAKVERAETERKRAEEALQKSEAKYSTVVETARDGIVILQDRRVKFANPQFLELSGYAPEELAEVDVVNLIAPKDQELVMKRYTDRMAGKEISPVYETALLRKDGATVPVELSATIIDYESRPADLVLVRDITERKQAENELEKHSNRLEELVKERTRELEHEITERKQAEVELRESEEKFRGLAEQSPNMIFISKMERVVYANKKCEEVMGYTREEFYSPDFDFVILHTPESKKKVKESLKIHMKGKEVAPYEYSLLTKEGKIIEAIITTKLITYEGESAILGIITDITGRKQAEEALQESEEKFRSIAENSFDVIYSLDPKGRIIYVSPSAKRVTGYVPEELVGKFVWDFLPSAEVSMARKRFSGLIKGESPWSGEINVQRKDGSLTVCEINLSISFKDGNVVGIQGILRDVTKRKQADEEMKRRLMKFKLEGGNLYMVKEPIPALSLEAFEDLLQVGYSGLVISRTPGEEFKKNLKSDFEFIKLAERGGKKTMPPKFRGIESKLESLSGNWVVLIDRLDYLIFKNGFRKTLSFMHRLSELVYLRRVVVILSVDSSTLKGRELRLLEKEVREVERRDMTRLHEDLLEVLWFIYQQNNLAVKPSYTDIGKELGTSRPTTRRRVGRLISTGLVRINVKGNKKVLELTERGLSMFLK